MVGDGDVECRQREYTQVYRERKTVSSRTVQGEQVAPERGCGARQKGAGE